MSDSENKIDQTEQQKEEISLINGKIDYLYNQIFSNFLY